MRKKSIPKPLFCLDYDENTTEKNTLEQTNDINENSVHFNGKCITDVSDVTSNSSVEWNNHNDDQETSKNKVIF